MRSIGGDVAKGMEIAPPAHYYPGDDVTRPPLVSWRAHAHLFYSNWLNYCVYQATHTALTISPQTGIKSVLGEKVAGRSRGATGYADTLACPVWGTVEGSARGLPIRGWLRVRLGDEETAFRSERIRSCLKNGYGEPLSRGGCRPVCAGPEVGRLRTFSRNDGSGLVPGTEDNNAYPF